MTQGETCDGPQDAYHQQHQGFVQYRLLQGGGYVGLPFLTAVTNRGFQSK